MIIFIALLLVLPVVFAQVRVQLGDPYVNIKDTSKIKFMAHSDYYEMCSLDRTTVPILITNQNKFSDTFRFEVDKEYASLSVKSAVLKSGKSAVLPLTIIPPADSEDNTTLILDIITEKEALKRSVIIKTNIKNCYLFDLTIDNDNDEICGCDKETYSIVLQNNGRNTDTFTLTLDTPEWVNLTLENDTFELYDGGKKEIQLEISPSCEEKGSFTIDVTAVSEKSKVVLKDELEFNVLSQNECYNTIISADNVNIDYFGKNIPVTIKNKGIKNADYSLSVEGVEWYTLSQTEFSLKPNGEKTLNLALYPYEDVVEGDYGIDIKAKANEKEVTKSISVKLKKQDAVSKNIKFYLNYFKYFIGLGVILLIIILGLKILIKKNVKKRIKKIKKEEKKVEEKKVVKQVDKPKKKIKLWPFIIYFVFLALLVLFTYSTFKYKEHYEKALSFVSGLFTNYVVPYGSYFKYLLLGIGIILIIILVIDFFRKKSKRKAVKKKVKVKKEKIIEIKKISIKKIKKRKLKLFEYIYLVLVILLFLAIVVYTIYRFSGKSLPFDKLVLINTFLKAYYPYFIAGIIILVLGAVFVNFLKKKLKKIKEQKSTKKSKKINKNIIRNIFIGVIGLIVLSGIVYSFVYYSLINYIKDFVFVYYSYILMGLGILVILILILHFQSKNIHEK
jgi:MFS family permease